MVAYIAPCRCLTRIIANLRWFIADIWNGNRLRKRINRSLKFVCFVFRFLGWGFALCLSFHHLVPVWYTTSHTTGSYKPNYCFKLEDQVLKSDKSSCVSGCFLICSSLASVPSMSVHFHSCLQSSPAHSIHQQLHFRPWSRLAAVSSGNQISHHVIHNH